MKKTISKLISEEKINRRITHIALEILLKNIGVQEFNFVNVLEGGRFFSENLNKKILMINNKLKINNYSIKVQSYIGTESSKQIKIIKDLEENISEKNAIIIEDIIDTGRTLNFLINYLIQEKKVNTLQVATLLDKISKREIIIPIDYIGFEVPNKFLVGCGMDYNERFRELPYIGMIN